MGGQDFFPNELDGPDTINTAERVVMATHPGGQVVVTVSASKVPQPVVVSDIFFYSDITMTTTVRE